MSIKIARPPVEVEVMEESPASPDILFESELSRHIHSCWDKARNAKLEITERLLKCERQRRGVYDPDRAMEISRTGGSDIFMMLTDIKCRGASAWIKDVMINMQDRPFQLDPAEEPAIPPEIRLGIIDMVKYEAEAFLQSGQGIHPDAFRSRMEEVHEHIMNRMREEAKESATLMEAKIEDQLKQGKFFNAFRDFIDDFVTYPTAIFKGPNVKRRKRLEWAEDYTPVVISDFTREFDRVSPFDIYPAPSSSGPNDSYIIQRHRLSRGELSNMRGTPGYSTDAIDQVLERYGKTGLHNWMMGDQERDNLEGKPLSRVYDDSDIETLEFWGPVSGHMLLDWGMKDKTVDENKEYEVNAWMVGPHVIKVIINPDPLGQRPYEIAQWGEIPGAFWGTAMPETMRDVQIMCNAAARALANNMGVASGPQVEVMVDRLPDGEDLTAMYPWKIWQAQSDRTGGGQPAVRFFQPNMNAEVLLTVYQQFAKQADEVTGIPNYIYGSSAVSGAGRTASGLSMLMDNAAKGIKLAISHIDRVVSGVVGRLYVHNMMYDPDHYIKGDFKVTARGAMGLLAKEQLQIRRNEFLQATANPVDLQIIGIEGRAYLLREVARSLQMDTDKIVPSTDQLKFKQEQTAQMAQLMQAQQQAAPQTVDAAGNPAGGQDANLLGQT